MFCFQLNNWSRDPNCKGPIRANKNRCYPVIFFWLNTLRADLHGTTLSYKASLGQARNMTKDHLHAHDIFIYKIKYAKGCNGIFGAKALTHGKQIF